MLDKYLLSEWVDGAGADETFSLMWLEDKCVLGQHGMWKKALVWGANLGQSLNLGCG